VLLQKRRVGTFFRRGGFPIWEKKEKINRELKTRGGPHLLGGGGPTEREKEEGRTKLIHRGMVPVCVVRSGTGKGSRNRVRKGRGERSYKGKGYRPAFGLEKDYPC